LYYIHLAAAAAHDNSGETSSSYTHARTHIHTHTINDVTVDLSIHKIHTPQIYPSLTDLLVPLHK